MNWIEIAVHTTTEAVEVVSNILLEVGSQGVLIEDPSDAQYFKEDPVMWNYIGAEVFHYDHQDTLVIGYFTEAERVEKLEQIQSRLEQLGDIGLELGSLKLLSKSIDDQNWLHEWKKYYKPELISETIVVKPTWEDYQVQPRQKVIELDPGMAFGTGTHATTQMCVQAMEQYLRPQDTVADIGCGSGILSIAAVKLGAGRVTAVDLDPMAVRVTTENVNHNRVADRIEVLQGDLAEVLTEKVNLVVANIIADAIIALSVLVKDYMEEDAYFISSGIIDSRYLEVRQALEEQGFDIIEVKHQAEWKCIVAKSR